MTDDDALGRAGRAGGVDDVSRVIDGQRPDSVRIGDRLGGGIPGGGDEQVVVEADPLATAVQSVEPVATARADDAEVDGAVVEEVGEPVVGHRRVDRHVGATGEEHRELRCDGTLSAREQQRDRDARSHTAVDEDPRQPLCPEDELVVAQRARPVDDGVGMRMCCGRAGHEIGEEHGLRRDGPARGHQKGLFVLVEDVEVGDPGVRSRGDHAREDTQIAAAMGDEFGFGIGGGVGLEVDTEIARAGTGVDGHREILGGAGAEDVAVADAVAEDHLAAEHHHVDGRTEEAAAHRRSGRRPRGQIAAHVLEAIALVAQGPAQFGGDAGDEVTDTHVVGDAAADGHDVGDHAARTPEHRVGASRHRQAEHHVVGTGHPGDVDGERRTRQRRHGDRVVGAVPFDVGDQAGVEFASDRPGLRSPADHRVGEPDRVGQVV